MPDPIEVRPLPRLNAAVHVPGSKSYTQRALVIASLAEGQSFLQGPLASEDTDYLTDALRVLGAEVLPSGKNLAITGTGGRLAPPRLPIFLGNNGTAARFLLSVASLGRGDYHLTGSSRLCERPMKPLLDALRSLGGAFTCGGKEGCLPLTIHAQGIQGGKATFSEVESSQYISSLLISAPHARKDVEIEIKGFTASRPYIAMTMEVMRRFGVSVERKAGNSYFLRSGQRYRGTSYAVEGDASSASYFFLAAALCQGKIRVSPVSLETQQGDGGFLRILEELGCVVSSGEFWVEVEGRPLPSGDRVYDMSDMPDMVPTLAVLSAVRPGRTVIHGAAHLRIKESNRLETLARELAKTGIRAEEKEDGLMIEGGSPRGAEIETYDDHRIAMSFAMLGLAVAGMRIQNGSCVGKSFPGFWEELGKLYGNRP